MSHLFESIKAGVVRDIATGLYDVGQVLPPADQLARRHHCSTGTVRRALTELADEGLVRRVRSKGTVVYRRPRLGHVWVALPIDDHMRLLLQDPVYHALQDVGFDVTLLPASLSVQNFKDQVERQTMRSPLPNLLLALEPKAVALLSDAGLSFQGTLTYSFGQVPVPVGTGIIMPDLHRMARMTVEHLLSLGHRHVAVIAGFGPNEQSWASQSAAYARDLLEIAGARCSLNYMARGQWQDLLHLVKHEGCTAYWALNDHEAMRLELLALRSGVQVPQQLSIVGRWDTPWSKTAPTPLTTVSLDPPATAKAIAQWLLAKLKNQNPPLLVQVPPQMVVRQSTMKPQSVCAS